MSLKTLDCPVLTFRGFRGQADYPAMAAAINGSKIPDGVERTVRVEDIANTYAHLKNCDPYRDMVFVEAAGQVVGYGRGWWEQESSGTRLYIHIGFLLPEWRRRGIGRAMLRRLEARLREVAADHPHDGARYFQAFAADTAVGLEALLRAEGYAPVRHFFDMLRPHLDDIPDARLPEGVELRPVLPEHYRRIWEAADEAFRDHWGYVPPTEVDYRAWLASPDFQPDVWQVAWHGDEVVGMVQGYINAAENAEYNRLRGYTEGISVVRAWRRRGVASALISENLRELKARGMTQAALGMDTQNPTGALRVYERAGFRVVKRNTMFRKPLTGDRRPTTDDCPSSIVVRPSSVVPKGDPCPSTP